MPFKSFHCRRCGRCCTVVPGAYDNTAETADMARWRSQGLGQILDWVGKEEDRGGRQRWVLWVDPQTGERAANCPWLIPQPEGGFNCRIQASKPLHCRSWPPTREDAAYYDCPCARKP